MVFDVSKIKGMTIEEAGIYLNQLFEENTLPFIAERYPITNVDCIFNEESNKIIFKATIKMDGDAN